MKKIISSAIAVFVVTLMSGCTSTHKINVEPRAVAPPPILKTSLHAGVYYSPQFANQEAKRAVGPHLYIVPIGAASTRLFNNTFPLIFRNTTLITKLSAEELSSKGVDVIIVPSLDYFDFRLGMDADKDKYSVSYRMTLYNKRGVPVSSWIVPGNATGKTGSIQSWIEDDLADAADKFLRGFEHNAGPALSAIAQNPSGQSTVDPKNVDLSAKLGEPPGFDPKQAAALQKAGVVTFLVTVRSNAEKPLVVRASDMRLRLPGGQPIEPSSASTVLGLLEQTSQTGGIVGGLFGAPLGVFTIFVGSSSNDAKRESTLKEAGRSLFEERTLKKGVEESGIVFFSMPKGIGAEGATLSAWAVDPASAEGVKIEVLFSMPH